MNPSFADIVQSSETVTIRGMSVEVTGLDLASIAKLGQRFPALAGLLDGFKVDALLQQPRAVVGAVLAAGTGKLGDAAEERGLGNLKLSEQAELAAAIVRQTGSFLPFVNLLAAVAGVAADMAPAVAQEPKPLRVALRKRSQSVPIVSEAQTTA